MNEFKYERVLLKLSGEALQGEGVYGIDPKVVDMIAESVKEIVAVSYTHLRAHET